MPAPPETTQNNSDPAKRDDEPQDIPAETERLVRERTVELQAEIDTLHRENTELKRAEEALRKAYAELDERVKERTKELASAITQLQVGIEERERTEVVLRENEAKYRTLFDSIDEGFCTIEMIFDADDKPVDYRFLETNRAFERQTGMHDAAGKRMREFVPNHEEHWFEIYGTIARTGEPKRFIQTAKPLMGGWYDVYAFPYGGPNSNRVAILFNDITERKRTEEALVRHTEELTQLTRQLEEADREANLYLDILTHDLGNTANVSNLYADLLVDNLLGKGEAAQYAEKLQRSVRKSIEILRTVSKIRRIHSETAELGPTDLDAVIREESSHFPEGIIRYRGSPYLVQIDSLLPEVFSNLICNAVKHGGSDVAVTIWTEGLDGFVQVSVEDTGPGVPDEQKEAIFHCYEQQRRGVGEGLGLYLVQILVERYGGRVWVEDRVPGRPEGGAAFKFTLRKAA